MREDVIRDLRTMATSGASLAELVCHVQESLGFSKSFVVPVLAYFCAAFSLPLREVLPLREWITDRDDREVEGLVLKIRAYQPEVVA